MGSTPFPSSLYSRILAEGFSGDDFDDVTVQKARDGSEQRLHNFTAWHSTFTLRLRTAAERATFLAFKAARFGGFDSFPFTSPDDSVTRQVKFEAVEGAHIGNDAWDYRISLVEVL